MPTYRNITIKLVSQFDILTIPEYAPPATLNDPFSIPPHLVNAEKSLVSVYVPTYPLSQFWLSYSISAPHPPGSFCYFKLFINGASIVSWGCGKDDGYKGKTMFSLFDSGERWMGFPGIDVRAFSFASDRETVEHSIDNALGDIMEVRVYRSKGRARINPELEDFKDLVHRSNGSPGQSLQQPACKKTESRNIKGGVRLLNAGPLQDEHPRRYYKYALVDPLDKPFATFRWYYRTWGMRKRDQRKSQQAKTLLAKLEALGVISPGPSAANTEPSLHSQAEDTDVEYSKTGNANAPTPPPKTGNWESPDTSSDISPLNIRSLSVSAIPLFDLPLPQGPVSSPTKRLLPPMPPLSSETASTQSCFARLIRRSSRSPSPPKISSSDRPCSPALMARSTSMGAIIGVVQNAVRRQGRNLSVPRSGAEARTGHWKAELRTKGSLESLLAAKAKREHDSFSQGVSRYAKNTISADGA